MREKKTNQNFLLYFLRGNEKLKLFFEMRLRLNLGLVLATNQIYSQNQHHIFYTFFRPRMNSSPRHQRLKSSHMFASRFQNRPEFSNQSRDPVSPDQKRNRIFSYRKYQERLTSRSRKQGRTREEKKGNFEFQYKENIEKKREYEGSERSGKKEKIDNKTGMKIKYYGPINPLCRQSEREMKQSQQLHRKHSMPEEIEHYSPQCLEICSILDKSTQISRYHDPKNSQIQGNSTQNISIITLKKLKSDNLILTALPSTAKQNNAILLIWIAISTVIIVLLAKMIV